MSIISRQEAAVMLLRAYEVYGGETPKNTAAPDYSDFDAVDDWARSSVATLSQWGVMNGSEEGSFSPQGLYTTEQCLVTFLRTDLTGRGGRSASYTYFVYQEGGIKSVDLGPHRIQSGLVETDTISDCFFDDTGRIFCCTIFSHRRGLQLSRTGGACGFREAGALLYHDRY